MFAKVIKVGKIDVMVDMAAVVMTDTSGLAPPPFLFCSCFCTCPLLLHWSHSRVASYHLWLSVRSKSSALILSIFCCIHCWIEFLKTSDSKTANATIMSISNCSFSLTIQCISIKCNMKFGSMDNCIFLQF